MRFILKQSLNQPPNDTIKALLPAEQVRIEELTEQGIVEAMYVSADRSVAWVIWNCKSRAALDEVVKTLPIYDFMNIDVTPLAEENH